MSMCDQLTLSISDFVTTIEGLLDVPPDVARSAAAHLFGVILHRADPDDSSSLFRRLQGIETLLRDLGEGAGLPRPCPSPEGSAAPGSLSHIANLQSLGVPMHDISLLVAIFLTFVRKSAEPDCGSRIIASVPELRILAEGLA